MASFAITACGGGSSSGGSAPPPAPPSNASPGGIWRGVDSLTGNEITGLVDEAGDFHFLESDGTQFAGTASTTPTNFTASFEAFAAFGSQFQDGSNHGTGSLSGTIKERATIDATANLTTDNGATSSATLNLTFDTLYNRASSLATIAGNCTDSVSGTVVSVNADGTVFSQDASSGCTLNGVVSVMNASYNAYKVKFSYSSCLGSAAVLNGINFTGIGALDNTVSPERAIIGVTADAGAPRYAFVFYLNRS